MDEKELLRLADDGCPHTVPMTAEEIVADPATFVKREWENPRYCLFVAIKPAILWYIIGTQFPVEISLFTQNGQIGSLIETQCKKSYFKLISRFYPPCQDQRKDNGTA